MSGTTLIDPPGGGGEKRQSTGTTLMGSPGGTRLHGFDEPKSKDGEPVLSKNPQPQSYDPVVGWLVVTAGPGKGASVPLGDGLNIVGRGHTNRVVLDFGDEHISTDDHFRISYDKQNRDFHLVPGRGTNLLYINGSPLLSAQILENGTDIKIGDTVLRFMAFCTKSWSWE